MHEMQPHKMTLGVASVCLCLLLGCAFQPSSPRADYWDGNLVRVGYSMADTLADSSTQPIGPSDTFIVPTFVSVTNPHPSSSFRPIIPQQIASRFAQRRQHAIEMTLPEISPSTASMQES